MGVLIDTGVLIDIERGAPWEIIDRAAPDEPRGISVITVSELWHGVHRASAEQRPRRQAFVERLLDGIEPIAITTVVARLHASVGAELASRGEPIGNHDLWIAATAIAHDLGVLTGNVREFARVPGLRVVATGGE